jgi:hypothetical protein
VKLARWALSMGRVIRLGCADARFARAQSDENTSRNRNVRGLLVDRTSFRMVVLLAAFPDSIPTLIRWIRFPGGIEFTFLVPLYGYRANDRPDTVVA